MRPTIAIILLVAASFTSFAFSGENKCSAFIEAMPICDVLANASKYDGRDITVRGIYYRVIHGSSLTASACKKTKVNMRSASDWKTNKRALVSIVKVIAPKLIAGDMVATIRWKNVTC